MQRVLPPRHGLPLFDTAAIRGIETRTQASLEPGALMQRAGLAVARLALALAPHARRFAVLAGPGNNGGDGFEAALHLQRWGKQVEVTTLADASKQPADARAALQRARDAGVTIADAPNPAFVPEFALDALLGIGTLRPPEGAMQAAIQRLNALACPVLAVDLPSGLHADTGAVFGTDAVVAQHTLSLLALKPGLFTHSGRDHAGTVWTDSLGADASGTAPSAWLTGEDEVAALGPRRRHAQHKGSFGDVVIVGGARGMGGAAWLAARAALAAGAGRVYVDMLGEPSDNPAATHDPGRPEIMLRPGWARHATPPQRAGHLVVCGCGGGDAVAAALAPLLSQTRRLVLDADALNAIAADSSLQALLAARPHRGHPTVLTPHPLEAARLLGCSTADVQADRVAAATRLAQTFGSVVVLKGSGTVVAEAGRVPALNGTGNAALASAGTGDVLAGWLGGRWSQDAGHDLPHAAFDAARAAVFLHGQAANHAPAAPLRAGDLIELMHRLSVWPP